MRLQFDELLTPKDRVHPRGDENVILEDNKNNLWVKYPTPTSPPFKGRGDAHRYLLTASWTFLQKSVQQIGHPTRRYKSIPLRLCFCPFRPDGVQKSIDNLKKTKENLKLVTMILAD